MVLHGWVDPQDFIDGTVVVRSASDASYADDRMTRRSTIGYWICLIGPNTFLPFAWGSTLLAPVTLSTTETEAAGIQKATRVAIRVVTTIEPLLRVALGEPERIIQHEHETDSKAAVGAVENGGNGSALAHMSRTHGTNVAWLSDYYKPSDRWVTWTKGENFVADGFTKHLDDEKFGIFAEKLGLNRGDPIEAKFTQSGTGDQAPRPASGVTTTTTTTTTVVKTTSTGGRGSSRNDKGGGDDDDDDINMLVGRLKAIIVTPRCQHFVVHDPRRGGNLRPGDEPSTVVVGGRQETRRRCRHPAKYDALGNRSVEFAVFCGQHRPRT